MRITQIFLVQNLKNIEKIKEPFLIVILKNKKTEALFLELISMKK